MCAIFPLGRAVTANAREPIYFAQPAGCGFGSVKHTPREWLAEFGRELQDQDDLSWMRLTHEFALFFANNEKKLVAAQKLLLWKMLYRFCYLQYDTARAFSAQFAENVVVLHELLRSMEKESDK